jgi:outer membrane protein OmpA-like peptidoglycan-associated protein
LLTLFALHFVRTWAKVRPSIAKLYVDTMTRLDLKSLRIVLTLGICAPLVLAGCETVSGTIFPDSPSSPTASATPPSIVAAPQAGTSQFLPVMISPGAPSGSPASGAIEAARNELVRLQGSMSNRNIALGAARQAWTQDVAAYRTQKNVALRPMGGDTRAALAQGDAVLTRLAGHSQKLSKELEGFAQGNAGANAVMRRLDAVAADNEADRDQLNRLRNDAAQMAGGLDSLVNALSSEIAQNTAFIAKERASLASLGLTPGPSPSQRASAPASAPQGPSAAPIAAATGAPKPASKPAFVTIKFDRPSVTYREALGAALKQALLRRPDAAFDVVGVTASAAQEAQDLVKARAEDVSRTMMELGVAATKIGIDSARERNVASDEVRIFVR